MVDFESWFTHPDAISNWEKIILRFFCLELYICLVNYCQMKYIELDRGCWSRGKWGDCECVCRRLQVGLEMLELLHTFPHTTRPEALPNYRSANNVDEKWKFEGFKSTSAARSQDCFGGYDYVSTSQSPFQWDVAGYQKWQIGTFPLQQNVQCCCVCGGSKRNIKSSKTNQPKR
jgi:hypothetical protein